MGWDYVGTALRKYHAIGTLAGHERDGDTLSIRLQVPTCRAATVERDFNVDVHLRVKADPGVFGIEKFGCVRVRFAGRRLEFVR